MKTTRSLFEINVEIKQAQDRIQELYIERRGKMIDDRYAYCCLCGKNKVCAASGFDTCENCAESV